jgi:hypothetical protein
MGREATSIYDLTLILTGYNFHSFRTKHTEIMDNVGHEQARLVTENTCCVPLEPMM